MMRYKVIATDVDGTIGNDQFVISKENMVAMRQAVAAGIKVVLCSGRTSSSLHEYEQAIGLNIPGQYGIGFNGAVVYDAHTQKSLFADMISQETARHVIKELRNLKEQGMLAVYLDSTTMIAEHGLEEILAMYNNEDIVTITYHEKLTEGLINQDVLNMYCIQHRPVLDKIHEGLKARDLGACTMAFSHDNLLEFLPKSQNLFTNKAEGLKKLCEHLGITMDEIVTVGDNYNDLEMIEEAGLGIAVANGVEALKAKANYVTKRNNNEHIMEEVVAYVLKENAQ